MSDVETLREALRAWLLGNPPGHEGRLYHADVVIAISRLEAQLQKQREAVEAADAVFGWIAEHHPLVLRELPTTLYRPLRVTSSTKPLSDEFMRGIEALADLNPEAPE